MAGSEVYGVGPELPPPSPASRAAHQQDGPRQLEAQGSGCCGMDFMDDPCDDCPAAHQELEQHCADCGIGETEEALIVRPRHGGDVLLCEECDRDARSLMPEEYRNAS